MTSKMKKTIELAVALTLTVCCTAGHALSETVAVNFCKIVREVKPLHGVNNAPVRCNGRQDEFRDAGIPFVRTHDTAGKWGGTHFIDIPNLFPDFDADENRPESYDFAFSDAYLRPIVEAGCAVFFRLGVTIENDWRIKAYNIFPPRDFAKWARICEHVVRHYNEGWANGYRWNIRYWEIWNEPENPPMWQGTREEYFELYRVSANHLKKCFPYIRIGGYAGCGFYAVDDPKQGADPFAQSFVTWFETFVKYVQNPETKAPLDFFSWHLYIWQNWSVSRIGTHADYVRRTLDAAGLTETESIFDEWNVFRGPQDNIFDNAKEANGAASVAASFCLMQKGSVDKAMYYDALPTRSYGGLFYFPSERTTPCYQSFRAFNVLYRLGGAVDCVFGTNEVYAMAAAGGGDKAVLLANVSGKGVDVTLEVTGAEGLRFNLYRIDQRHPKLDADGLWSVGAIVRIPNDGVVLLTTRPLAQMGCRHQDRHSVNGLQSK